MLPTLTVYVPTSPHLQAVRALAKHKIVLLLGDAGTGKSTIAAILATTASEDGSHRCFKLDGPDGLLDNWNTNENNSFFWVDDAFGPNQAREDFIDRWISLMPKVQAAMAAGNRFVLTSRRHIYEAAKPKLGSRNHPLLRDGQAIVNIGYLTSSERRQILYNHIKAGTQTTFWKSRVKPQLTILAEEPTLLPEIARRLGDPTFTRHTTTANDALLRFIREPKEHLLQTIRELSKLHRAALTLVFLHRGHMPVGASTPSMQQLILNQFSVDSESLGQGILQLRDSFLAQTNVGGGLFWSFKHPTIADAISATLGETEGMAELYLRGTKSEAIIAEAVCVGAHPVQDAVVIPEALNDLLVERLAELPDEASVNRRLFSFLYRRTSDSALRKFIDKHPVALQRYAYRSEWLDNDPTVLVRARAFSLGVLPVDLRDETATLLEDALLDDADTSFLNEDMILALLPPTKLLRLASKIRDRVLTQLASRAAEVADDENLDLDGDPADNFTHLRTSWEALQSFFDGDESVVDLLSDADAGIDAAIESVEAKKEEKEKEERDKKLREEEEAAYWEEQTPARSSFGKISSFFPVSGGNRSIFSDVDE
jgi:energy-coupling factor transporter ATP-binding protein EcfA2